MPNLGHTTTLRATISGSGVLDQNGTLKIKPDTEFVIEVYSINNDSILPPPNENRMTWISPFTFTGDISVQWLDVVNDEVFYQDAPTLDKFVIPQFRGFWDAYVSIYTETRDGNLPDRFGFNGLGFNFGYPPGLGEIKTLSWRTKTSSTSGQICIEQGDMDNPSCDWLFDDNGPTPSFSTTCWEVWIDHHIVSNLSDGGTGSLRAAIIWANDHPGPDTISFTVSGIISLISPLPALIDDSTVILGSTAPGGTHSIVINGAGLTTCNGLVVQSCNNKIEGLTIKNFPGCAIEASGALSVNNMLTNNIIYSNAGLAIDLNNDGVTLNDPGDLDTGPNNLLNYPEIDSVFMNPDSSFTVYGRSLFAEYIELYLAHPVGQPSKPEDPSGHGEAYSLIGFDTTSGSGDFDFTIAKSVGQFSEVSAIAVDDSGNTSEFCGNFTLTPSPVIIVASCPDSPHSLVHLWVTDPEGFYIGEDALGNLSQTLFPATYTEAIHDSVNIVHPKAGDYNIVIIPEQDAPVGAKYSIGIRIDGSDQAIMILNAAVPPSGTTDTVAYMVQEGWHFINGDANRNGSINALDVTYLINYLYKHGPIPNPIEAGDATCNGTINALDVTCLINFLYKHGPAPCQL